MGDIHNQAHKSAPVNSQVDSGPPASAADEVTQAGLSTLDFIPPILDSSVQYLDPAAKIDFVHGSNSACLEQVIREGLLPFSSMNKVPFSGALDRGILENGVNQTCISAVEERFADRAFSYALDGLKGWNPFFSCEESKFYTQKIDSDKQDLKKRLEKEASVGYVGDIEYLKDYIENGIDHMQVRLNIESQRRLLWDTLNENQRELIRHPFPVLLGITHEEETQLVRSQITGERGLPSVSPQNLIIFVPESQLERTRDLVMQASSNIPVRSLLQFGENLRYPPARLFDNIQGIDYRNSLEAQGRLLISDLTEERLRGIEFAKERCLKLRHTIAIQERLSDCEPEVVLAAVNALGEVGDTDAFAVLKRFSPPNVTVREAVSKALFDIRCRIANR